MSNHEPDDDTPLDTTRRRLIQAGVALGGLGLFHRSGLAAPIKAMDLPFSNGHRPLVAYPQKRPLMVMTARPVQFETPMSVFDESVLTPNDAFFVRWHIAGMPTEIDPNAFKIQVHGKVRTCLYPHLGAAQEGLR